VNKKERGREEERKGEIVESRERRENERNEGEK
jgi:hypothetical protein